MLDDPIAFPRHGGALAQASARHGVPIEAWLDLSTGINPHPYPCPPLADAAWHRLPDPAALASLVETARRAYGLSAGGAITATPGSDVALRLLPWLAPAGPVAILGPTYSGHAEAWRDIGAEVGVVTDVREVPASSRVVVVVNPNNPDGRITDPAALLALARRLAAADGLLVVDEAFADVAAEASIVPHLGEAPILVLRSFGKFYGLAGLRLGFALGHPPVVRRLGRLLGDWPVSGAAIAIGGVALADTAWQAGARERLRLGRERLSRLLAEAGLGLVGGTDLFVLAQTHDAAGLHEALAAQGLWTRIFADQPGRIRFGLPADDRFGQLAAALRSARGVQPPTGR
jgi:cobalamin biosynthetic protein CobC